MLKKFQASQDDILYGNGTHRSHDMFLDLDDMYMCCLACKAPRDNGANTRLRAPCPLTQHHRDEAKS